MASKSICPACGADIEIPDDQSAIRCDFCGTELRVVGDEGEARLRVLSQPEPQKDILTERAHQELSAELESKPEGEPVALGYASSGSAMADPGALSYPAALPEVPATVGTIPETPPYQEGRQQASAGGSGSTMRWIAIGIAVFVVACILLACVAAAIFMANMGIMS